MNAPVHIEHLLPGLDHAHLDALEEEAIFILREVAAAFERPALLFSGGKDSCVVLTGREGLQESHRWRRIQRPVALPVAACGHRPQLPRSHHLPRPARGADG